MKKNNVYPLIQWILIYNSKIYFEIGDLTLGMFLPRGGGIHGGFLPATV